MPAVGRNQRFRCLRRPAAAKDHWQFWPRIYGCGILYVVLADNRAESHVARRENARRPLAHVGVARILEQVEMIEQ
jgi:hypothetical protein